MGFCLAAHRNCPKIFHGRSQITPAHPSSYFMTGPLNCNIIIPVLLTKRLTRTAKVHSCDECLHITIQYNTIQCNAMQCNAMQCNAMQCNAMQCNAMQCNAMQCNAMQCNAMQCNAMQFKHGKNLQFTDVKYD